MADERCPRCGSTNITGRSWDGIDGDELQERSCADCHHAESRPRRAGGGSWYDRPTPRLPVDRAQALLAEIYAAPDDDGPRSVYADALIERGDPRGTFIALQLARVRDRRPLPSTEEQALLDEHWLAWGSPSRWSEAVAFERGFVSRFTLRERNMFSEGDGWRTVRHVTVDPYSAALVPRALELAARSLRSITLGAPSVIGMVAASGLALEAVTLDFDTSRIPPDLAPLTALPKLSRLGLTCFPEFAPHWVERIDAIGIHDVRLATAYHADYARAILAAARCGQTARLTMTSGETTIHADRDQTGALAVRSIHIAGEARWIAYATQIVGELGRDVDPGVKLTTHAVTAALAEQADAFGLPLVERATSFEACATVTSRRA